MGQKLSCVENFSSASRQNRVATGSLRCDPLEINLTAIVIQKRLMGRQRCIDKIGTELGAQILGGCTATQQEWFGAKSLNPGQGLNPGPIPPQNSCGGDGMGCNRLNHQRPAPAS